MFRGLQIQWLYLCRKREASHCALYIHTSMTSLLTYNVAHFTRHSFRPKTINQPLKKFLSLEFASKSRKKLDVILENKVVKEVKFSKNFNNKKCAPKIIFFNEKKTRKIRTIFDIENWL